MLYKIPILLVIISCSNKGDTSSSVGFHKDQSNSVTNQDTDAVSGQLRGLKNQFIRPKLVVFDHTTPNFNTFDIKEDKFSIPISFFVPGKHYSFHILDRSRWVASIKFSTEKCGVTKYLGGLGFYMGDLRLESYDFSSFNPHKSSFNADIGGGFSLDICQLGNFDSLLPLAGILRYQYSSNLIMKNPLDIFYHFLSTGSQSFDLDESISLFQHTKIKLFTNSESRYSEGRLVDPDPLISHALKVDENFNVQNDLWKQERFTLPKKEKEFFQQFFSGAIQQMWSFSLIQMIPTEGQSLYLPIVFSEYIRFPGYVTQYGSENSPLMDLNFESVNRANGLTMPICLGIMPKITIKMPLVEANRPPPFFNKISLRFKYFSTENGNLISLSPQPNQFPEDYSAEKRLSENITWSPLSQELTLTRPEIIEDKLMVSLPTQIFLKEISSKVIDEVRTEIHFSHTEFGTESLSIARFSQYCTKIVE
jgi:hypothetical protein